MHRLAAVCFFTLCALPFSSCIFEDQQGKYDWHKPGLGRVVHASLHTRKPRLSISTQDSLLATLNLRDGATQWRLKYGDGDDLDGMAAVEKTGGLITSSGGGKIVRGWDQMQGALNWEVILEAGGDAEFGAICLMSDGEEAPASVGVLSGTKLTALNAVRGQELWTVDLSNDETEFNAGALSCSNNKITVAMTDTRAGSIRIVGLSQEGHIEFDENLLSPQHIHLSHRLEVSASAFAVLSMDNEQICWAGLTEFNLQCGSLKKMVAEWKVVDDVHVKVLGNQIVVSNRPSGTVAIENGEVVSDWQHLTAVSNVLDSKDASVWGLFGSNSGKKGSVLKVVDAGSGRVVHEEEFPEFSVKGTTGPESYARDLFLGSYKRSDNSVGYRALVVGADDSLSLLQQGQVVWTSEQALSSVVSSLFLDPPADLHDTQKIGLMKRLRCQILSLKVQFGFQTPSEKLDFENLSEELSGKNLHTRDSNGARKFIISLSQTGKLFALHNGDGHIVWSRILPQNPPATHLLLWRFSHNLNEPPLVLVLRMGGVGDSWYAVVDAHSGDVVEDGRLTRPVDKVIELPQVLKIDKSDQHVFLLVDSLSHQDTPRGTVLPESPASLQLLSELKDKIHFWRSDNEQGTLTGYGIEAGNQQGGGLAEFSEQWNLAFHVPILATAARDKDDPVHSYVKVLGDRTLKFKYLNPNTLFVATGLANYQSSDETDSEDLELSVYVIDTVTGRILFRQVHPGARGPVHIVFSQHWIVYHYWSMANARYQVSSLELYDSSHKDLTVQDLIFSANDREELSSYNAVPVEVLRSTHFLSAPIKALGVTKTTRGITTQHVLFGTIADQVYSMDKRFLDPRRPRGRATREAQEERLIPYAPNLLMYPTHYTTQNKQVFGMKGLVTSPSGLESGCHLFSYGTDLFYARLQPEKAFDSLEDDFAFAFLVLTIVGMMVGSVILHYMVKRAKLAQKWK